MVIPKMQILGQKILCGMPSTLMAWKATLQMCNYSIFGDVYPFTPKTPTDLRDKVLHRRGRYVEEIWGLITYKGSLLGVGPPR